MNRCKHATFHCVSTRPARLEGVGNPRTLSVSFLGDCKHGTVGLKEEIFRIFWHVI
jgi:hypothetical protein